MSPRKPDQDVPSPYDTDILLSRQVKRIRKMITELG